MNKFAEDLKKRNTEQTRWRTEAVYSECINRGCTEDFVKAFEGRVKSYPLQQTTAFLDKKSTLLGQWEIYVEVMLEKYPEHAKADEWKNHWQ